MLVDDIELTLRNKADCVQQLVFEKPWIDQWVLIVNVDKTKMKAVTKHKSKNQPLNYSTFSTTDIEPKQVVQTLKHVGFNVLTTSRWGVSNDYRDRSG